MLPGLNLYYVVYALSMLFIGLASKEILVADPALLVAITFLIFSFVAISKLGPVASEFFQNQEKELTLNLTSTNDSFKADVQTYIDQENLLQLADSVIGISSDNSNPVVNQDLNPYISGILSDYLVEDFFLTCAYRDLLIVLVNAEEERLRRLSTFSIIL